MLTVSWQLLAYFGALGYMLIETHIECSSSAYEGRQLQTPHTITPHFLQFKLVLLPVSFLWSNPAALFLVRHRICIHRTRYFFFSYRSTLAYALFQYSLVTSFVRVRVGGAASLGLSHHQNVKRVVRSHLLACSMYEQIITPRQLRVFFISPTCSRKLG